MCNSQSSLGQGFCDSHKVEDITRNGPYTAWVDIEQVVQAAAQVLVCLVLLKVV